MMGEIKKTIKTLQIKSLSNWKRTVPFKDRGYQKYFVWLQNGNLDLSVHEIWKDQICTNISESLGLT